mmetsp:Transcript_28329/g.59197  ORF Transcript_28329/g.59197 Transcript_28329/m.59197 type:complete len:534 (-) Transcript_28329:220-1821(-)
MMPEHGSGRPPSPPQHDYYYDDDQPGQEISFDDTGKTIVAGNRIDIESDDGRDIHHRNRNRNHDDEDDDDDSDIHLRTAKSSSGRGGTCHWLKASSSRVKYVMGLGAILFVAFIAVMAVGLVQMSSSSTSSDGGDGSVSSAQLGDEVDGGIGSSANGVDPSSSPTMTPIMETRTSSAPTQSHEVFPVEDAEIQITLPNAMEVLVQTLGGDVNDSDAENWEGIEVVLEDTISSTLQEQLPDEYVVDAVQIVQFDDFVPGNLERTRLLQNDGDNTHTVIYSTSVTVNCANSDCSTASEQIEDAVSYLSTMEFELTSTETTQLTDPPTEAAETTRPTGSPTGPPSKAPTGAPTVDSTYVNTISVDETSAPTSKATSMPSLEPSSTKPTTSPTSKPTTVPRLEIISSCSADEPCGMCKGQCQDDTQCQTGLQCFRRIYLEYIPGCIGPGNQGQNYCYDPFAEGSGSEILLSTEDANCDDKRRCEKCFGDCNSDDECEKGLYCYRRAGFELVPGCAGQGVQGRDYCFDPEDIDGGEYR